MTTLRHRHSVHGIDAYEFDPLVRNCSNYEAPVGHDYADDATTTGTMLEQTRAALAVRAAEAFDVGRPSHLQALVTLWSEAFPNTPFPEARHSHKWAALGFQQVDPVSDLRGAGYLGLLHLTQFMRANGPSFLTENAANGFPLALASMSCTAMLCRYFGLSSTLIFPGCDMHHASQDVIRSFLQLQAHHTGGHDVLQIFHVRLVRYLAWKWAEMQGPATTIMDFNLALRATYTHLHKTLGAVPRPWQLGTATSMLEDTSGQHSWHWEGGDPVCATTVLAFLWLLAARLACTGGIEPSSQKHRRKW